MAKIKHATFREIKAIIGSHEVEFDAEGVAEVTAETADSIRGVAGFEVIAPQPKEGKEPEAETEPEVEAEPEAEPEPEVEPETEPEVEPEVEPVREPAVGDEGKRKGRPKKNQ